MIQDLETYRNNRGTEFRPAIDGTNALAFRPEVLKQPHLRILKPSNELPEPVKIESFLKRRSGASITPPHSTEVLAREQIVANPEAKPDKFIEREIDPEKPWSAFGQIMLIKEHEVDGKIVKKIAAISMAYPGGVGTRMAREILGKTIGVEESKFQYWKGEEEGGIIAASKQVPDIMQQFDLMDGFVENSGVVIEGRHAQTDHEVVRHFFGLQDARRGFMDTLKEDARKILENPGFTKRSAFDERYEGKGVYLIEGIIEDGVWDGGDPNGNRMRLVDMAADEAHRKWLQWAEKTANKIKGDGVIVDAEDTETVSRCGGADDENKGCSAFFEKMEGGLKVASISGYSIASGIAGAVAASENSELRYSSGGPAVGGSVDREKCSSCGLDKFKEDGCKCS